MSEDQAGVVNLDELWNDDHAKFLATALGLKPGEHHIRNMLCDVEFMRKENEDNRLAQQRANGMQLALADAERELAELKAKLAKKDELTDEHKKDRHIARLLNELRLSAFRNERLWEAHDRVKDELAKARASCKRRGKLIAQLRAKLASKNIPMLASVSPPSNPTTLGDVWIGETKPRWPTK